MRAVRSTGLGTVVVAVGLVLMVVEAVLVFTGGTLGLLGTVILWVGFGLIALGALVLLASLFGSPDDSPDGEAASGDESVGEPVERSAGD